MDNKSTNKNGKLFLTATDVMVTLSINATTLWRHINSDVSPKLFYVCLKDLIGFLKSLLLVLLAGVIEVMLPHIHFCRTYIVSNIKDRKDAGYTDH